MKKVITLVVSSVVALSLLSGCGKSTTNTASSTPSTPATSTPAASTPAPSTPAPAGKTGTFTAKDDADQRGYTGEVTVTYDNGKLTKVVYDEVGKDGKKKSEDTAYADAMKKTQKITPAEVYAKLTAGAVSGKVDTVTGATQSSTRFKALFEKAQAMK